ncbi:hypothetical protein Gpo141_00008206 [Globisporangium polare]
MSSDALADDELPSLFAVDEPPPPLTDNAGEGVAADSSSALPFASTQPLSAAELADLFRAIDDDDDEQQSQSQPVPGRSHKKAGVKAAPKRTQVAASNKARDGRKEELMYLRKTVLELETRLDVLKNSKKGPATASSYGLFSQELSSYNSSNRRIASRLLLDPNDDGGDRDADLDDVWKEIARRQCDQREASERENIRLRVVLESQIKVARSLEKFLLLKAEASSMEIGKSVDLRSYGQLAHFSDLTGRDRSAAIFQSLLASVDQMLAEVDAVYEANGLARIETTQIDAQTRFDLATGMRVEVCASKVLPFGVHETGAAVWNHYIFAKQRMPSRTYSYHSQNSTDATEDTIVEDYSVEVRAKNTSGSFRLRKVTRRVIEEERVVIVWCSFSDPLEISEQRLSGLRSLEKGYIVIRKSASSGATLLQPCHIMYPCASIEGDAVIAGDESEDAVVGAITDFRMASIAEFVASTYDMVENVLLEQALKRSGGADFDFAVLS